MIFEVVRGLFVWFALLTPTLYLCWSIRELRRMRQRHEQEMERIRREGAEFRSLLLKYAPAPARTPHQPNGPGDESPQGTEGDPRERAGDAATVER